MSKGLNKALKYLNIILFLLLFAAGFASVFRATRTTIRQALATAEAEMYIGTEM